MLEARAHLARAEGRPEEFTTLLRDAAALFTQAGHPRDAARCAGQAAAASLPRQAVRVPRLVEPRGVQA